MLLDKLIARIQDQWGDILVGALFVIVVAIGVILTLKLLVSLFATVAGLVVAGSTPILFLLIGAAGAYGILHFVRD